MSLKVEPEYFKKHLKWLTGLGIDLKPVKDVWYEKIYKVYSVTLLSYVYLYSVLEMIDIVQTSDFDSITFGLSYAVTHILGSAKIAILIVKKKTFRQMLRQLEKGYFVPNMERGGEEEFRLINAAIRRSNLHADVFKTSVYFIIGIRCLYAIFDDGTCVPHTEEIVGNDTACTLIRTLPYKAWFPVDLNKSPAYEIMFVVQASCLILYGLYICFLDSIAYGMMHHMSNQYLILRNILNRYVSIAKSIVLRENPNADTEDNYLKDVKLPEGIEIEPKLTAEVHEVIQRIVHYCARYHLEILNYCGRIENEFRYLMLVQFLSSLYILCLQLFQLSLVSNYLSFDSISMCLYLILMMYQLFCYCWYGNEILVQSSDFSTDIYNTDWLLTNSNTRKSLLLMMMRVQRPTMFTAGKFALLSLPTYMSIVRGSGSYFMVLRQMQ
nr:odorant receptor [Semanotus bifasciatus]